ncbi:MAG: cysteine synthase [Elusimicrobia bacterium RIFCSPLOWO2_12_FULL_59_9]|nr:MAG: cysteine synthase [Elusimicrobia bacterium RIFCSPLOWO2_12_FULL_59_9]
MVGTKLASNFLGTNLTNLVRNTPLVRLSRFKGLPEGIALCAKLEKFNPGGSVKDRPVVWMIEEAIRSGHLTPGKTILDATSGNTGIAYAWVGALLGFPVLLAVPKSASLERKKLLEIYGARVIATDPLEGSDGAIRKAREIYEAAPDKYFYADQYGNPANWRAHYESTGPEIWEQTRGEVTHFVAGLGTSGSFTGVGRFLKKKNPDIRLVSVQPDSPLHGLEGLKHMESSIVPGIYDPALADENVFVSTEQAQSMVLRLAREEGVLAGPSSGAAWAAALQLASRLRENGRKALVVALFPDGGERYLSERFLENLSGAKT